ncbi:MAG: efflux RND transporter periplasmic adaptor subunit [Candidatus Omnitrophota bacterium]|jgi:multidrug efflux pump subunit AcrA (membrane-fusion protein)|nr:MAG: efflux RND transporter periplasmic adaptor subunit [Candidatus Omnitrophota bacterium]
MFNILRRPLIISIFVLFICLQFITGCRSKPKQEKINGIIPVKINKIELKSVNESIDYVGDIKARDEALIYPKVSGKIAEKKIAEGSNVKKGEAIVYIDRDEVGLKFQSAPVESTIDGVVGRVYVDIGENVDQQTPVALVVNMDQAKINLDVPEKYISRILIEQESSIKVDAYPDKVFTGKVTKISPVVDISTRTAPVEILVDNPGHELKSGMFARVNLVIDTKDNVPVLLKEAVMGKDPNLYVYIIENGKAVLKQVTTGIRHGPFYEIKTGLKEGDSVVVVGQQKLYEGASVAIERE